MTSKRKIMTITGLVLIAAAGRPAGPAAADPADPRPSCANDHLCSWEQPDFTGPAWHIKNPHTGDWCTDLGTARRSGVNNTKLDLTINEGNCANPKRAFFLKSGERREAFPHAVRSIAHCRSC